tara:strand:- start:3483 stop:3635 length:153 start_codon:yes stop_codon:yes gene_type:complete
MKKATSLKSRVLVILIGIAIGYLAKAIVAITTPDEAPKEAAQELLIDWNC